MWAARLAPRFGAIAFAALVGFAAFSVLLVGTTGLASASANGCAVTVTSENAGHDAIQLAIDAHPGGVICVGPGTYPEQLTIASAGTTLRGAGATRTVLDPASPLTLNTYDYDSAASVGDVASLQPAAAIVLVDNTTGVTITNLGINGAGGVSTFTGCADNYYGVDFQDSSGTLSHASVTNVELSPSLFGCQDGLGVYAYNGYFFTGEVAHPSIAVSISHTTIGAYDKNGITCDDPGETCYAAADTVTGIGPTASTAQNGVQIAFGALGFVTGSRISANSYTGAESTNDWYAIGYAATGVLLYDPASGTTVQNNPSIARNQIGVAFADDGLAANGYQGPVTVLINGNHITSSNAYGIVADGAPGGADTVYLQGNHVNDRASQDASVWGAPAVLVDTGTFVLSGDTLVGSSSASGSSNGASQIVCGTVNTGTGNPSLSCPTNASISTAAVEAASENASNPTNVVLAHLSYASDSQRIATLGVLGGNVDLRST